MERIKIHKKISKDNEFYLYMNGVLIYKKWLNTGDSKVFDVMAYDKYTHISITDLDIDNSPFIINVKARVRFLTLEEGGRGNPVFNRYRPNHVFEYEDESREFKAFMGELFFENPIKLELGETYEIGIRFVMHRGLEKYLEKGRIWYIHEGHILVGEGEILEVLGNEFS